MWYFFFKYKNKYRNRDNDKKNKIWFVLDRALILPEYIIEYNYEMIGSWKDFNILINNF